MRGYATDTDLSQTSTDTMDWTPEDIRQLREQRGETQTRFGLELYDTTEETAQVLVSDLERGRQRPGKAAQRTLERMKNGEL